MSGVILVLFFGFYGSNGQHSGIELLKNCGFVTECTKRTKEEYLLPPTDMDSYTFNMCPCYCDKECSLYGDCCIDVAAWPTTDTKINNIPRSLWTCQQINDTVNMYAVTGCPSMNDLSSLCSKIKIQGNDYHYMLDLPVYSETSNTYFGNVFCAMCNGEASNIQSLNMTVKCTRDNITHDEIIRYGVYKAGLRQWIVNGRDTCYISVTEPVRTGRYCVRSIPSCPMGYEDVAIAAKCSAYSLTIAQEHTNMVYRNPHCAICNGAAVNSTRCWKGFSIRTGLIPPSLSMVMNFNWDFDSCNLPSTVWDGLRGKCTRLPCSDESCVPKNTSCLIPSSTNESNCIVPPSNASTLRIEGYLTVTCLTISIFCLLLHNMVYYTLPSNRTNPARILNSLTWSLILAQFFFLLGVNPKFDIPKYVCQGTAATIHFFFLAAFFWMNVMSIDIYKTFSYGSLRNSSSSTLTKYAVYAWGAPLLIVTIALVSDLTDIVPQIIRPYYAALPDVCWFANRVGLGLFLYLPICSLLVLNVILFAVTVCWFQKQTNSDAVKQAAGRKEFKRLWLYVKLSTIMGVTWTFGMIAGLTNHPNFWYPFIFFNGLQGAFIFFMFNFKTPILNQLREKIGSKKERKDSSKQSTSNTTSTRLSSSGSSRTSFSKF